MNASLAFDDVFLVPQFSNCVTRSDLDTSIDLGRIKFRTPIISANMDTVTESEMSIAMWQSGAMGALHRFMSIDRNVAEYKRVRSVNCDTFVSIGVKDEDLERAHALYSAGATHFIIDIAHGHSALMRHTLKVIRNTFGTNIFVVAGNVATARGVEDLVRWGADCIKVGIGAGSCCKTRVITGHGVPMFSCLLDCCSIADSLGVKVIADGGIRSSGDIVKSIVAGADMVMIGSLLAGTPEAPGDIYYVNGEKHKSFRGMASSDAMISRYKDKKNNLPVDEGVSGHVVVTGTVSNKIQQLTKGLQSGMSYSGASTLSSLQVKGNWKTQTGNGNIEGLPKV